MYSSSPVHDLLRWFYIILLISPFFSTTASSQRFASNKGLYLIAHRGGVVDSTRPENSKPALKEAYRRGYQMVELDLRLTKDSVFILHHDKNLKRYFGIDREITDMTWAEIRRLKSNKGTQILQLEEALKYCKGRMEVMIDNKVDGSDTVLFGKLLALLSKYRLLANALMIGTDESTEFFTGKIKLSCTRQQLEENMNRPDYSPQHYYLFGADLTGDDVAWALSKQILTVGVLNAWRYRQHKDPIPVVTADAKRMQSAGIRHFQLDTVFEPLLQR